MRCWNAESQIQLREYGRERMHGCDLTPARYDLAVAALGGHGELVERAEDLPGAIERSLASGKPACINVMIESIAAPVIRHSGPATWAPILLGAARIAQSPGRGCECRTRASAYRSWPALRRYADRHACAGAWTPAHLVGLDRAADTIDCRGSPPGAVTR